MQLTGSITRTTQPGTIPLRTVQPSTIRSGTVDLVRYRGGELAETHKDDAIWELATRTLEEVATESGLELVPDPGGAAFYGPKISVQIRDAIGRTWQMSTIQLDFQMPQRFGMEYVGADNARHQPAGRNGLRNRGA